jgi:syntaxin-binding protein 5
LTRRGLSVTALAIHPTGHLFSVGYEDGSIVFWAVEDEHQPLLVKTIEDLEIHGSELKGTDSQPAPSSRSNKEPIFKLSWSGFPNSYETILTILGGTPAGEASGLVVYTFPAYNPLEFTATFVLQSNLSASSRDAMCKSLVPSKTIFFPTSAMIQDFLLIPRSSPHFSMSFDPISILLLCGYDKTIRSVEAYQFPSLPHLQNPITESVALSSVPDDETPINASTDNSASSTKPLELGDTFHRMGISHLIWNGGNEVTGGSLVSLDRGPYIQLVGKNETDIRHVPLNGGSAMIPDLTANEMNSLKVSLTRVINN